MKRGRITLEGMHDRLPLCTRARARRRARRVAARVEAAEAHARVQVLGLLESRMNRAELVICAGLNEGVWPVRGGIDALLAPPVLRALGVPGADFRIGLSAHDLAGALGAPMARTVASPLSASAVPKSPYASSP